ncbi:DUF2285 domain-containing protein [Agrobacterium genomosp. 3]|jgi:hypothetical protein|uniref:DUF2285 domain-containing protein n=2 Tax=Hyphomicrobiales TaxID=356 RepID=A0AA50CK88_9HYPH|nr:MULTISPECIES: DUF2285 domain-containing protein [Hyphomicrobiales]KRA03870.1 hypothetical protein ASD74_23050 [Rhizobium sp. Root564]MBX8800194.1 DUF2285 domain-containing protein [Ochrobactrum sp. MR28]MBX8815806.1 DUF2285 domain-containing protein [Ochrobactrum sp. MR31]MCA1865709.1 DUF2285 domain-containing protein [Agrobacterium tomkonis]MCA1876061.1 DUF2285 domain-containing protein [Agrobacterium tumefaciens]PZU79232.1 MAG: DUF2285 domain-containing protein [Rhizobium sp.]
MTKLDYIDQAPEGPALTEYDRQHIKLYMRLLDAENDGASWQEAVEILFQICPDSEPERARRVHDSHLARAHWMTQHGYRQLRRGLPN